MTSHREAPGISSDPAADNTDVYAFVSPDKPSTVTLISNFIPLQGAAAGPNFYRFDPNVLYEIMIDNDGDGIEDVTYQFRFQTNVAERRNLPLQRRTGLLQFEHEQLHQPQRPADLHRDEGPRTQTSVHARR